MGSHAGHGRVMLTQRSEVTGSYSANMCACWGWGALKITTLRARQAISSSQHTACLRHSLHLCSASNSWSNVMCKTTGELKQLCNRQRVLLPAGQDRLDSGPSPRHLQLPSSSIWERGEMLEQTPLLCSLPKRFELALRWK